MEIQTNLSYGPHAERNSLDLYLPEQGRGPWPLVVCIHGGGWCGGDKGAMGWLAERLARRGVAAASITYRFWPQWPCPAAMQDTRLALRWLQQAAGPYGLDMTRVGLLGGSAGAHLAAWAALAGETDGESAESSRTPRVKCVVDCYGPVDFVAMMSTASAELVQGFMNMPLTPQSEQAYRDASPMFLLKPGGRTPPPFLIVHGTADVGIQRGQVPLTISERFCEALRQAGGDATLVRLQDAPHGFTSHPESPHAQAMWQAAWPFLENHLLRRQP